MHLVDERIDQLSEGVNTLGGAIEPIAPIEHCELDSLEEGVPDDGPDVSPEESSEADEPKT